MDKKVFRKYMDEELIQKTVIFADVFGLSIDQWKPAKENSKFPYRIYLYEKNNIVGYLDVEKKEYGSSVSKYPIELYTPVGNIVGYYNEERFNYSFEKTNSDTITQMRGLFSIKRQPQHNYEVKAYLEFKNNAKDSYSVSFNDYINPGALHLSKNHALDDLFFYMNYGNQILSISHKTNVVRGYYTDINSIIVTSNTPSTVLGTFQFNDFVPYEKDVTIENVVEDSQKSDTLIDLEKLNTEITNHDHRIFEFIDEVRESLSIPSNKGTISIYDKLAFHCFHNDKNNIKCSFIRDKNISEKLIKNPVLQKMANYKK